MWNEDELVMFRNVKNAQPNLTTFKYIDDLEHEVILVLHVSVMWILPVHN